MGYDLGVPPDKRKPSELQELVMAFQQGLGERLVALVLFGSRARGEADETSDWDVLLIARHLPEKTFQRHLEIKSMLPVPWRARATVLARTPEEFESHLPSLYLDIALDGIVLHDTDQYMTKRLASLRRLIKKRGLRRESLQRETIWRWQRFPGLDWTLEWERMP